MVYWGEGWIVEKKVVIKYFISFLYILKHIFSSDESREYM